MTLQLKIKQSLWETALQITWSIWYTVQVNFLLNDVAVQVQSASIDISVQTEPLVNDFAVQVNLNSQRRSRLKTRQSMLINAMAVHNSCKKMTAS